MSGGSKTTQTAQQSQNEPWGPAVPLIGGILGSAGNLLPGASLTPTETGALNTLTTNANAGNPFAGDINSYVSNLLSGGGATAQGGNVSSALQSYQGAVAPFTNPSLVGQISPALRSMLDTARSDVTNTINSMFAGAGRDLSGANQMALARGITQAEAPIIAQQYNTDADRLLNAANSNYNASNTTAGILSSLNQQQLANQGVGMQAAPTALDATNYTPNQLLQIEAQRRGIPASALAALASIGIPIASLGGTSNASGTQTTNQPFNPVSLLPLAFL
jgi:hypothetical protein